MGVLKSLGLSPVKEAGAKAIRRLFGRVMPAESDGVTASASASDTDQTGRRDAGNEPTKDSINTESQGKTNHESSSSPSITPSQQNTTAADHPQKPDHLSSTAIPTAPGDMASPQKQYSQNEDVDKENQPPNASQLSESLARLQLQDDKAISTSPKSTTPVIPTAPIFTDPAVVAERAMHMKFTEAALDMVSLQVPSRGITSCTSLPFQDSQKLCRPD